MKDWTDEVRGGIFPLMVDEALAAEERHSPGRPDLICLCGHEFIAPEDGRRHQVEEMLRAALAAKSEA